MRKIMFIGRTGAGKTTLTQALKGEDITYQKTQDVPHFNAIIDTPGEYCENKELAHALIIYSHEADILGLLIDATETYSLYSPNIVSLGTREVIGIVTHIHDPYGNIEQAALWLELAGCRKIFFVDSVTGEGIPELLAYLDEDDGDLSWDEKYLQQREAYQADQKSAGFALQEER